MNTLYPKPFFSWRHKILDCFVVVFIMLSKIRSLLLLFLSGSLHCLQQKLQRVQHRCTEYSWTLKSHYANLFHSQPNLPCSQQNHLNTRFPRAAFFLTYSNIKEPVWAQSYIACIICLHLFIFLSFPQHNEHHNRRSSFCLH